MLEREVLIVKTVELKKAISLIRDVVKYNNIRAITDLVEMYSKDGVLHIGATDNVVTAIATIENDNDFDNCIVSMNFLNNLVKLTTTEEIKMSVITKVRKKDTIRYLEFKGNGKHTVPIQTDENGEEFFLPLFMPEHEDKMSIDSKEFEYIAKRNGFSLLDNEESLNVYRFEKDRVLTTDSFVISCTNSQNLFSREIPSQVVNILKNIPTNFELSFVEDCIRTSCENCEIFIRYKDFDEEFPIDVVNSFLQATGFIASFTVDKKEFMQTLKRQNLFKLAYENPMSVIELGAKVIIKNRQESSQEVLNTINYSHDKHSDVIFNTDVLIEVIKNMNDTIEVFISEEFAKLSDKDGFYIISTADL